MPAREIVTVRDFAFGGDTVGTLADGRVCFFRGGVPGEKVEIEIVSTHKNFCRGRITAVLEASENRITPACPHFDQCPGCSYLHTTYAVEIAAKARQFEYFINRNRPSEIAVETPFAAPQRFNWRSRLRLHCQNGRCGYLGFDNKTLVEVKNCMLATDEINEKLSALDIPRSFTGTLGIDFCSENGAVSTLDAEVPDKLTGSLPGFGNFRYKNGGFFQTNSEVAAELCRRVTECVKEIQPEFMLELYCGVGVFSIVSALALPGLRCVGMEFDRQAVRCAVGNARRSKVSGRCSFFAGDAADAPERFASFGKRLKTLTLVDPPRNGLSRKMVDALLKTAPGHIIYISCGPDTLRRDLDALTSRYDIRRCGMLDMFPGTAHFESFVLLQRKDTV